MFGDYAFHGTMFHAHQWYAIAAVPEEPAEEPAMVSGGVSGLSGLSALIC